MLTVRPLSPEDWPTVAAIYGEGMAGHLATFETATPTWEEWDAAHLPAHRFVAELDGEVGVRERIGQLDGAWRDVVLLELRL